MVLSAEQQGWLKVRYDYWGLEAVKLEIERNSRDEFTPPDVIAFAHAWVVAEESKTRRISGVLKILAAVVLSMICATVAGYLAI